MRVTRKRLLDMWPVAFVTELRQVLGEINSHDSREAAVQHLKDWIPELVLRHQGMQTVPDDITLKLEFGVPGDPSQDERILFTIRGGETLPDIPILLRRSDS